VCRRPPELEGEAANVGAFAEIGEAGAIGVRGEIGESPEGAACVPSRVMSRSSRPGGVTPVREADAIGAEQCGHDADDSDTAFEQRGQTSTAAF
jgi:hypothetical protein